MGVDEFELSLNTVERHLCMKGQGTVVVNFHVTLRQCILAVDEDQSFGWALLDRALKSRPRYRVLAIPFTLMNDSKLLSLQC